MAKPIILILPINATLTKLREVLAQDKEVEFIEAKNLSEAIQHLTSRAPALVMLNDPAKCMKFLSACKSVIKKTSSKTMLLTQKSVPFKALHKMNQWGLSDHIIEPIAPKTLIYKVNFILRSLPKKLATDAGDAEVKFSKDGVSISNKDELEIHKKNLNKESKELENKGGKTSLDLLSEDENEEKADLLDELQEEAGVKKKAKLNLDQLEDAEDETAEEEASEEELSLKKKKTLGLDDLAEEEAEDTKQAEGEEELAQSEKQKSLQIEGEEELEELPDLEEEAQDDTTQGKSKKLDLEDGQDLEELPDLEDPAEDAAKKEKSLADLEVADDAPEELAPELADDENSSAKKKSKALGLEDLEEDGPLLEKDADGESEEKGPKNPLDLEVDGLEDEPTEKETDAQEADSPSEKKTAKLALDDLADDDLAQLPEEAPCTDTEEDALAKLQLEKDAEANEANKELNVQDDAQPPEQDLAPKEETQAQEAHQELKLEVDSEAKDKEVDEEALSEEDWKKKNAANLELDSAEAPARENKSLEVDNGEDIYARDKKRGGEEDQDKNVADAAQLETVDDGAKRDYQQLDVEGEGGADWKKRQREIDNDWNYGKDKTDKFQDWKNKKLDEENIEREGEDLGEQTINYKNINAEYGEGYDKYRKRKKKYGEQDTEGAPLYEPKKKADKKAKLEISISEEKKPEEEEEKLKEKDEIFDPSTRGLEFAILSTQLYLNKDIKAERILGHLADSLFQEKGGLVTFLRPEGGQRRVLYSSHENGPNSSPEIREAWSKLRQSLESGLSQVSLPVWGDHTFTQQDNHFIYPLFEGVQELGHALASFKGGVIKTEDDCKLVEVILESARGIYLNEAHSEGKHGAYEGSKTSVDESRPEEKKGLFSNFFKKSA